MPALARPAGNFARAFEGDVLEDVEAHERRAGKCGDFLTARRQFFKGNPVMITRDALTRSARSFDRDGYLFCARSMASYRIPCWSAATMTLGAA
jgi:hypothetical protein